jgi:hypothetical protein
MDFSFNSMYISPCGIQFYLFKKCIFSDENKVAEKKSERNNYDF